jgi:hypothetical protein
MIRHLHPTDSPRLLAFKQSAGRAEAFTLSQALTGQARPFSAVKYAGIALSPRAWESCWIQTHRARIRVVVRAGPRSGPAAWEVRDLFLHRSTVNDAWDVLEQLSVPAGRAEARRLFLRLPQGSPIFDQARQAGYSPALSESLYRAPSAQVALERLGQPSEAPALRPRAWQDEDALFRLYCATTPVETRFARGQTMQEWADAAERPGNWHAELVLDDGVGHIRALVQTVDLTHGRCFSVSWTHDCPVEPAALVAAGLSGAKPGPALALVPAHNESLSMTLEDAGFDPVMTYDHMVKPLAVPVLETRRAVAAVG